MATSSMLRSVTVKNTTQCRKLVSALERAEAARCIQSPMTKTVHELTPEQMNKIFGKTQK